jgi:hypothetical protein
MRPSICNGRLASHKVLVLERDAQVPTGLPNRAFGKELRLVEAKQIATGCLANGISRGGEILRWHAARGVGYLRPEFASPATVGAVAGDSSSVCLDPTNLGVAETPEPIRIFVNDGYRADGLR